MDEINSTQSPINNVVSAVPRPDYDNGIDIPNIDLNHSTDDRSEQNNVTLFGLDMHYPVFPLSAGLVILFSALTLIFPKAVGTALANAKSWVLHSADWLFALTPFLVFAFCVFIFLSPLGRIRLGGPDARPDYRLSSWIAMLFASGVGVGFMFYGAAEPMAYYTDWYGTPLNVQPFTPEAERLAFSATLFHWGIAPWAIYALVGLALGYFTHNQGLPLTVRSAFYPLLGEKVWGWSGHIIDLFAVVSTIFGLATTIGLGATQAASGMGYILGFEPGLATQITLIATMSGLAALSVWRGIHGGVKLLSNINMIIALILLAFVCFTGPSLVILSGVWENFVAYLKDAPALTAFTGREDEAWFHDWTIFYWAWWVSWAPFVGMFIARISRGRTVREYIGIVLIVPFTIGLFWFTAFGETAIWQNQNDVGALAAGMTQAQLALFQMLNALPLAQITSVITIFLLIVFIVTSADSGALVVDSITSGRENSPVTQRILWACLLGLTASALLYGGGTSALQSLQAGTIVAALPFAFVLWIACISLYLGMRGDAAKLSESK